MSEENKDKKKSGIGNFFFMKIIFVIIFIAISIYLFIIFVNKRDMYDLEINKSPARVIHLQGQFPYEKGLTLAFNVDYSSSNPACKRMAKLLYFIPVAEVSRRVNVDIPVKKISATEYKAEVVLDRYSPGYCDWKYAGVGYQISGGKQTYWSGYSALGKIPESIGSVSLNCKYRSYLSDKSKNKYETYLSCDEPDHINIGNASLKTTELNFLIEDN